MSLIVYWVGGDSTRIQQRQWRLWFAFSLYWGQFFTWKAFFWFYNKRGRIIRFWRRSTDERICVNFEKTSQEKGHKQYPSTEWVMGMHPKQTPKQLFLPPFVLRSFEWHITYPVPRFWCQVTCYPSTNHAPLLRVGISFRFVDWKLKVCYFMNGSSRWGSRAFTYQVRVWSCHCPPEIQLSWIQSNLSFYSFVLRVPEKLNMFPILTLSLPSSKSTLPIF